MHPDEIELHHDVEQPMTDADRLAALEAENADLKQRLKNWNCGANSCTTYKLEAEVAEKDKRIAELEALLQRSRLQEEGVHPAPCAQHCEAAAFNIEIRRLQAENAELRADAERWKKEATDRDERLHELQLRWHGRC